MGKGAKKRKSLVNMNIQVAHCTTSNISSRAARTFAKSQIRNGTVCFPGVCECSPAMLGHSAAKISRDQTPSVHISGTLLREQQLRMMLTSTICTEIGGKAFLWPDLRERHGPAKQGEGHSQCRSLLPAG